MEVEEGVVLMLLLALDQTAAVLAEVMEVLV